MRWGKAWRKALFLCLALCFGLALGILSVRSGSEDQKFEKWTDELFRREITGNTLTLHYTLAHPETMGIRRPEPSLGSISWDAGQLADTCETCEKILSRFSEDELSEENRITRDMLLLYFHTQAKLAGYPYLEEPLSPSLGIQAQLPVLLAEYAFYEEQDIIDYLKLLQTVRPYFESILDFERKKSEAGMFMSDETLDRILKQCKAFIKDPESNYMLELFEEKLRDFGTYPEEEQKKLIRAHRQLILNEVIPAYQMLMEELEQLRGTGGSSRGLAAMEGGEEYYQALIQSETGCYLPIRSIEQRLTRQMAEDMREINAILKNSPGLMEKMQNGYPFQEQTPEETLKYLKTRIQNEFPEWDPLSSGDDFEIRYVHSSMEQYSSPAFYLTPPLDTKSPNVIYINRASKSTGLDLFATLAHEGFPGHLYQTVFFEALNMPAIRSLFSTGGYVEGWATYVESYAYLYGADLIADPDAQKIARLAWLNRSINLCIYSLTDIGIHAHNWSEEQVSRYLRVFGITDERVVHEIFQYIVETPANYLKYYPGYLSFLDLQSEEMERLGSGFDLKDFHEKLLRLGPVPFPVIEKYLVKQKSELCMESVQKKGKKASILSE